VKDDGGRGRGRKASARDRREALDPRGLPPCGNFSYRNGHGTPVRFPLRTLEFKVQCGPPRPHPEQRRQASPSILPTAFVSHRRIESGWLAEFLSAIFLDC